MCLRNSKISFNGVFLSMNNEYPLSTEKLAFKKYNCNISLKFIIDQDQKNMP